MKMEFNKNESGVPKLKSSISGTLLSAKKRGLAGILGIILLIVFSGCATKPETKATQTDSPTKNLEIQKTLPSAFVNQEPQPYRLQVEDEIEIKFHLVPELNDTVKVRPDGKISLQIVDEIDVLGITPAELDKILTKKYAQTLKKPDVTVIVRTFSGQKVFVGGEVNAQGMVPIHGQLTITQAIMQAGGFKNTAEMESVVLLRNQGKPNPYFTTLNLESNLTASAGAPNDVLLQPYDVVFVPKSTIATMDQFVDQYINQLVPRSVQFGFQWLWNLSNGGFVP